MTRKLTVVPERCSGCRMCELVCALRKFKVNNPKKAGIRVLSLYPHPVVRMPIFCMQCRKPKCQEACSSDAIFIKDGVVLINEKNCTSCQACVVSCPFGAIFVHPDIPYPFKCDLCGGIPKCAEACPKKALLYMPEHTLGQAHRLSRALRYAHMKEVEYTERGVKKKLRYANLEAKKHED